MEFFYFLFLLYFLSLFFVSIYCVCNSTSNYKLNEYSKRMLNVKKQPQQQHWQRTTTINEMDTKMGNNSVELFIQISTSQPSNGTINQLEPKKNDQSEMNDHYCFSFNNLSTATCRCQMLYSPVFGIRFTCVVFVFHFACHFAINRELYAYNKRYFKRNCLYPIFFLLAIQKYVFEYATIQFAQHLWLWNLSKYQSDFSTQ